MDQKEKTIGDFINDISPDYGEVVQRTHEALVALGCGVKLQEAKSGHVVSYNHPQTKKAVANFVSRKSGPVVRIYGDNAGQYLELLEALPEDLEKLIAKASACRRMLDATKCNARCPMGYDLTIKGNRHQKCRYSCFMFPLNSATQPHIQAILERELQARSA